MLFFFSICPSIPYTVALRQLLGDAVNSMHFRNPWTDIILWVKTLPMMPVSVPTTPLTIKFHSNTPRKAMKDALWTWASVTHMGDPCGFLVLNFHLTQHGSSWHFGA